MVIVMDSRSDSAVTSTANAANEIPVKKNSGALTFQNQYVAARVLR
jgi:hypothetical protein